MFNIIEKKITIMENIINPIDFYVIKRFSKNNNIRIIILVNADVKIVDIFNCDYLNYLSLKNKSHCPLHDSHQSSFDVLQNNSFSLRNLLSLLPAKFVCSKLFKLIELKIIQ